MIKKIPILNENDINSLIELALKNDGALTASKEISQMLLNVKGVSINAKPRKDGRYQGYVIENGIKKYVYGKTKNEVTEKIKDYLKNGFPKKKKKVDAFTVPVTFNAFTQYYFENFRKRKVAEKTYIIDMRRYNKYILPVFKETPLKKVTPLSCQNLIDGILKQKKGKTAEEIHSLLSIIFKGAIKHGIISKNPLDVVFYVKHQSVNGKALTIEEERTFKAKISILTDKNVAQGLALMLFTGMRPNELETAKIEDKFIVAQNSKRHNKKIEFKRIPILTALKPFIKNGITATFNNYLLDKMRRTIKNIFPNHILYDLRTTFYTRCKEYGVSDSARNEFVGHSFGTLGNTYTDLSDEYLLKEAQKLELWQ